MRKPLACAQPSNGEPASPTRYQAGIDGVDRGDHVARLPLVMGDGVVERAVRLDVAHRGARRGGQPLERADLVDHVGHQVGAGHVHVAAAEAGQVAVGHVRADHHATLGRAAQGLQDAGGVAGMEAAGHVGAGHDASMASSSPMRQAPRLSPRSLFRSIAVNVSLLNRW